MEGYAELLKACFELKRKNNLSGKEMAKILNKIRMYNLEEDKNERL